MTGYINGRGEMVIQPQFVGFSGFGGQFGAFIDGLAPACNFVATSLKCGYISR